MRLSHRYSLHLSTLISFLNSANDCKQRRPGVVFAKIQSTVKPEVIDKEYEAFMADLDGGGGGKANAKTVEKVRALGSVYIGEVCRENASN
jgi:hypothetical protein